MSSWEGVALGKVRNRGERRVIGRSTLTSFPVFRGQDASFFSDRGKQHIPGNSKSAAEGKCEGVQQLTYRRKIGKASGVPAKPEAEISKKALHLGQSNC